MQNSKYYATKICHLYNFFNIKPIWYHSFQGFSPEIFPFKGICWICLINKCYRSIIQKSIVTLSGKMSKKVFLHAGFRTIIFNVVFIIIQSFFESIYSLTHILLQALFSSYSVNWAFFIAVKLMVYFACLMGHRTVKG